MPKRKRHDHGGSPNGVKRARCASEPPSRQSARLQEIAQKTKIGKNKQQRQLLSPTTKSEPPSPAHSTTEEHAHRLLERHNTPSSNTKQSKTEPYDPIKHWVTTTFWPEDLWREGFGMPDTPSSKRRSSSSHRSEVLARMANQGVSMETSNHIQTTSEDLCHEYLSGSREIVKSSIFSHEEFAKVLARVRSLNETRIQRDVTPWVVPSAETLFIRGELDADWIGEELNAEWIRCGTLGSTVPKPDYTAGLLPSSFSQDEIRKLANYASSDRPFYFTPNLCFPFLMCEAKAGERGFNEAERQNIHSASIAVRAIILLYREAFGSSEAHRHLIEALYGQVLVFTISHDNDKVCLYGHFAVDDHNFPDGLKFHRYTIAFYSLTATKGADCLKAYNFVFNVYEKFAPDHRKRITDAVAQLPSPASWTDPLTSPPDSHGESSRGDHGFKVPGPPSSALYRQEMIKLQEQLDQKTKENKEQLDRFFQQMEQQRQSMEQQRQSMEQQRQSMEQQRQQERQQMEQQLQQQREDSKEQMQQLHEIIALLKATSK